MIFACGHYRRCIAPRNFQFFNKDWQPIGDKESLAGTFKKVITGVPEHILADGLEGNRPAVLLLRMEAEVGRVLVLAQQYQVLP